MTGTHGVSALSCIENPSFRKPAKPMYKYKYTWNLYIHKCAHNRRVILQRHADNTWLLGLAACLY